LRGKLICFTGLDGSGKSTQIALLHKWLLDRNIDSLIIPFGMKEYKNKYRKSVNFIKANNLELTPEEFELIKSAFHIQFNIEEDIKPEIEKGRVAILDRYVETLYSSAYLFGVSESIIDAIIKNSVVEPDLNIFIDVPAEKCHERILERNEEIKLHESLENLIRIRQYYLKTRDKFSLSFIDGDKPRSEVFNQILALVEDIDLQPV